ncbi:MAG: NADH-quinone oxidoreductase subunit C [Verrucomicrobiota bacterium]
MPPEPSIELIAADQLLDRVRALRAHDCRFVQMSATRLVDRVEVTYSFDRRGELLNLRLHLSAAAPRLPSISSIYGCVLLYENELHDLFNIQVDGMAVDFHGNLYKTSIKFPFGTVKASPAKPSPPPTTAACAPVAAAKVVSPDP